MRVAAAPWWGEIPPASGSIVMATGIVSVGLHLTGHETFSRVLLGLAGAVWVVLAVQFVELLLHDRAGWSTRADSPPALTGVAGTAVLGTRLAVLGWTGVAAALLVVAAAVWPVLLVGVLRHWSRPMPGAAFLVCVATQGLAVLGATLAGLEDATWLMWTALVLFLLGLVLYVEALVRFDFRQVLTGAGDHWIAAGALSISTLAGSKLTASTEWTGTAHQALRTTTLVLLGLALAWYAVLAVCELLRPRLRYDIRRWATVFPLGMTAAASLSTSTAAGVAWLDDLGRALLWVAVIVWALVAYGLAARLLRAGSSTRGPERRTPEPSRSGPRCGP
ncbi:tellurite resistance/C4-dicarboxylate transporter family protein [Yinghuangia seranimata]|uniref:tellurite resistance/C4-dicarboxylate transporter family protein n=1 Tax=Yinghuangia seranimata TaxID=408067 RepID=UPI00248BB22B|nr:tellurite resistance/C4-dicarboxylate transporter family protein [Yinghuangia seranimata]MDI2127847.1 tellurite resistance/C4-dicarboxylate transporter family protein [Yinghuangia seranimata]